MKYLLISLLVASCFMGIGCQSETAELTYAAPIVEVDSFKLETAKDRPRFWSWNTWSPDKDYESILQHMAANGMNGLLLSAPPEGYRQVVPMAQEYGIEVHAWLWILNNGRIAKEHPEWLSVNRDGLSLAEKKAYVDYYQFLCPAIPEVREAIYQQIDTILQIEGLAGISLDYTRYVDVVLPETLQPKYGIVQDKEYPEWDYGYHPYMIEKFKEEYGYDPRNQVEPAFDLNWNAFRYEQVNELVAELIDRAHDRGKEVSASPFPSPTVARRICKQDWGSWNLDFVFPMIYYGFYGGTDAEWIGACVQESVAAMEEQGAEVYAGFFVPDHRNDTLDLKTAIDIALANGVSGVSFFDFSALDSVQWKQLQELEAAFRRN